MSGSDAKIVYHNFASWANLLSHSEFLRHFRFLNVSSSRDDSHISSLCLSESFHGLAEVFSVQCLMQIAFAMNRMYSYYVQYVKLLC